MNESAKLRPSVRNAGLSKAVRRQPSVEAINPLRELRVARSMWVTSGLLVIRLAGRRMLKSRKGSLRFCNLED